MERKTFFVLLVLVAGILSCNDSDSVKPETQVREDIAPPPAVRTIYAHGRQRLCMPYTMDVYYQINVGSWTYLNSISTTECIDLGSFQASDGDVVRIAMVTSGTTGVSFNASYGTSCPASGDAFCDDLSGGGDPYEFTVSASITIGLQVMAPSTGNCLTRGYLGCPV